MMNRRVGQMLVAGLAALAGSAAVGDEPAPHPYLAFMRAQAESLRGGGRPAPGRDAVRRGLLESWGEPPAPADAPPPGAKVVGNLARDGYRVEKLLIETWPGVEMTANAYVPDRPGRRPAILMVHGHWKGAKQDPVVQARCIGAAKLGFFVLAVDALGAGERGVGPALGEYHGAMTAATLLPVGWPLAGLQAFENRRAVDYLRARPEVDPDRVGVTGASGGGNQTMYAGATDERLRAAVPVCSVGSYQAYLGAACCLCEVVPGALRFADESDVLGLVAPRALLVVSATRDAPQFAASEAARTLERARAAFAQPEALRHAVFDSGHDYNRPMREAMYGWMAQHLNGEGTGDPIAEPAITVEDPETLRCFPGETRPEGWATIPRIAAERGRALLAARRELADPATARAALIDRVLGGLPPPPADGPPLPVAPGEIRFRPEPGIDLAARYEPGPKPDAPVLVVLDLDGADHALAGPVVAAGRRAGWSLVVPDLRATGRGAVPGDRVHAAPDHNSAEWGLWIGRPLLGQWVADVRALVRATGRPEVAVVGVGPAGIVALAAAAAEPRIARVAAAGSLASFIADVPFEGQRLGVLAPGIVREVGDVAHLAALAAPRRVVIAGAVDAAGHPVPADTLANHYRPAASDALRLLPTPDAAALLDAFR